MCNGESAVKNIQVFALYKSVDECGVERGRDAPSL